MFGDFLNNGKHRQLDIEDIDDLEDGTPIVARYNNREFQFGVYGEGYVIYQDCWQTKAGALMFSLEQSSIEEFFEDSTVYEYTPDFEFDKKKAYYNARRNFSELGNKVIPASEQLRSVYGDDFTLMCMLDSIERFYVAFLSSRMGRHYHYRFFIGGIAPAHHHLLAIEEGFAVHFSKGDGEGDPDIIIESLSHIEERAGAHLVEVEYECDDVASRLLARNRALLIYSGKVSHGDYRLFANNCEHFAILCKTGRAFSIQVSEFFMDAIMVGLSAVAGNPKFAAMVIARRFCSFE